MKAPARIDLQPLLTLMQMSCAGPISGRPCPVGRGQLSVGNSNPREETQRGVGPLGCDLETGFQQCVIKLGFSKVNVCLIMNKLEESRDNYSSSSHFFIICFIHSYYSR